VICAATSACGWSSCRAVAATADFSLSRALRCWLMASSVIDAGSVRGDTVQSGAGGLDFAFDADDVGIIEGESGQRRKEQQQRSQDG
jgi:hypothetical protein